MSWIKLLAQQVRQDLVQDILDKQSYESIREIVQNYKHADKYFEDVVTVFKPLLENKEIISNLSAIYKNPSDLIQSYCTFNNDDSYQDSLHSATFSRRLNHFMFTNRAQNFGLEERSRFSDRLRNQEEILRQAEMHGKESKREFQDILKMEVYSSVKVRPCLTKYLLNLTKLFRSQKELYEIEYTLLKLIFIEIKRMYENSNLEIDENKVQNFKKSFAQLVPAMEKRGMDVPKVQTVVGDQKKSELQDHINTHLNTLHEQISVLKNMDQFMSQVIDALGIQFQD